MGQLVPLLVNLLLIFNIYILFYRDLESIERINKIKKTRIEDSDDEDLTVGEDNYEDEEVSVRQKSIKKCILVLFI